MADPATRLCRSEPAGTAMDPGTFTKRGPHLSLRNGRHGRPGYPVESPDSATGLRPPRRCRWPPIDTPAGTDWRTADGTCPPHHAPTGG